MVDVAVIGAGRWGMNLVRTFNAMGVLAAVAEQRPDVASELQQRYPIIPIYGDAKAVLDCDVEAVAIATLPETHFTLVKQALLADKDVFVEKPITLCSSEAEELQSIAEQRGRVLMVGHLLLYQPAIQWIYQYLQSGELGRLYALHQERLNLGTARSRENALWSLAVHDVAVLLYLVGQLPASICSDGYRALQPTVEDDCYVHMKFDNDVQANIHCSWLWPEKQRRLTVVGSKGMLIYDELNQQVTLHAKGIGSDLVAWDLGAQVVFEQHDVEPLRLELEHFIECVQERKQPVSDGANGVMVVKVLEQTTRAMGSC